MSNRVSTLPIDSTLHKNSPNDLLTQPPTPAENEADERNPAMLTALNIAVQAADQADAYDTDFTFRTDATLKISLVTAPHIMDGEIVRRLWVSETTVSFPAGLKALDL